MMGFWIGEWLHEGPDREFDAAGKRAVVKHLCFGSLETRIWYEFRDGQYCCEVHFIEGIQAGDVFSDRISKPEMMEVIRAEIALCQKHGERDMAAFFQAEIGRMEKPD